MVKANVHICGSGTRRERIRKLMKALPQSVFSGRTVAIKANFNSADRYPASTHPETLESIASYIKNCGARRMTLCERSGMGDTRDVLDACGINLVADKVGFDVRVLDEELASFFKRAGFKGMHWKNGVMVARPFLESDVVVSTCCLKTHRFGGHFTLSLKNFVGAVAKLDPATGYDYMRELHSSPHQLKMIAEINAVVKCDYSIMDCIQGLSKGGPDKGVLIEPGLLLSSVDRVALDACGIALLRISGTTAEVAHGPIFSQPQIARAAELGVGVGAPDDVELVPMDEEAKATANRIRTELDGGA